MGQTVNKQRILEKIIAFLTAELAELTSAANASFAAATDPDSKAENKYDTRSLEASYVARGQSQRVAELQEAVRTFKAMSGTSFPDAAPITIGSLVSLQTNDGTSHYFIAPHAGGTEVGHEGQEVFVITPASPLGQRLMGKAKGQSVLSPSGVTAEIVRAV